MNVQGIELPNPLELIVRGGDAPVGYACQKCGAAFLVHKHPNPRIYDSNRQHQKNEAAQHCVKECPCGRPIEDSYRLRCRDCRNQMEVDKEKARFEKSTKLAIEQVDGPLYWEGHVGSMGDGYFSDIDELLDYCEQDGVDVPEYVWACEEQKLGINAEHIVENAVSDMGEDAYDSVPEKAVDSLQAYLDVWCAEVGLSSWSPDYSRSVLLQEDAVAQAG